MRPTRYRMRGMTLIELMIVVVVVAILASIAIPSYRQYMIRATRTEAKTALLRVQAAQEKFYLQQNRYATTQAELTALPAAQNNGGGLGLSAKSEGGNYDIGLNPPDGGGTQGYIAAATPAAGSGQLRDAACLRLTIDHTGKRMPEITNATPCWR